MMKNAPHRSRDRKGAPSGYQWRSAWQQATRLPKRVLQRSAERLSLAEVSPLAVVLKSKPGRQVIPMALRHTKDDEEPPHRSRDRKGAPSGYQATRLPKRRSSTERRAPVIGGGLATGGGC